MKFPLADRLKIGDLKTREEGAVEPRERRGDVDEADGASIVEWGLISREVVWWGDVIEVDDEDDNIDEVEERELLADTS